MPSCKCKVRIGWNKEASLEGCFFIECIEGEGHDGEHQGQIYVWGKNQATGELGLFKHITWK